MDEVTNTELIVPAPALFNYIIVFDDEDDGKKGKYKKVLQKEDRHDAIMEFSEELSRDRRSIFLRSIHTIH